MRNSAKLTGWLCAALLAAGCGSAAASSATTRPTAAAPRPTAALHVQGDAAEQITAAMQRAGFKTGKVTAYTAATDPNHMLGRQGGYTSKTEWTMPDGSLNSVEVYPTVAGATKRVAYLSLFSGSLMGDGYDYQDGSAILRLSADLTQAQAAAAQSDFVKAAGTWI